MVVVFCDSSMYCCRITVCLLFLPSIKWAYIWSLSEKWKDKHRLGNTYVSLIMLHDNKANSIDTHTVLWGLRFKLCVWDCPDNLPSSSLNPLVIQTAGLWSSDQGSDNVAHSSLTRRFHPVIMWCKWKWKRPLAFSLPIIWHQYCNDTALLSPW